MIFDSIKLDEHSKRPLYLQIGDEVIRSVRQRKIHPGDPLPSVRDLAKGLSVSKITVEKALKRLVLNGYVTSIPKKGSFIAKLPVSGREESFEQVKSKHRYRFNFAENSIDTELFPFLEWRKALHKASRQIDNLIGYGEPQGQLKLREAIAHNIYQNRGVICSPGQVLIGAGLQTLLSVLLDLLDDGTEKRISFAGETVTHAKWMFQKRDWKISSFTSSNLDSVKADIVYINSKTSDQKLRTNLLAWLAQDQSRFVIEDDFEAEFRSSGQDAASLQGLSLDGNVIYYGSFSRLLTPALRVSFMVLPAKLVARFKSEQTYYVQSSSVLEQLALAEFISNGSLNRHLKRLKKYNQAKSESLAAQLKKNLGAGIRIRRSTNGTSLIVKITDLPNKAQLEGLLADNDLFIPAANISGNTIRLGFAGISLTAIPAAAKALSQVLKQFKK